MVGSRKNISSKTVRQKPKRLNNFMSNIAWQPPKPWTLADCLLVITEATSSAATGISTLLSASWGPVGVFQSSGWELEASD